MSQIFPAETGEPTKTKTNTGRRVGMPLNKHGETSPLKYVQIFSDKLPLAFCQGMLYTR